MSESIVDKECNGDKNYINEVVNKNGNKAIISNGDLTEAPSDNRLTIQDANNTIQPSQLQEKENETYKMNNVLENGLSEEKAIESNELILPPNLVVVNSVRDLNKDDQIINNSIFNEKINTNTDLSSIKHLTTSTYSLDDNSDKENKITKSVISKSAEDISKIDKSSSCTELMLKEYTEKKKEVTATQHVPELPQHLLDAKYVKLNRENLTQDLGNIVKNVHGYISSVSGSLKSVYGMSQKSAPAKISLAPKNVVNSRIIENIFEDEVERKVEDSKENDSCIETTPLIEPIQDSELEKGVMKLQVESLERMLEEKRREITTMRERVRQHSDELKERDQMLKELEGKMDMMTKRVEQAEKDKDLAVMRYANSERTIIEAKRSAQNAQKAEQAALAEVELLNNKIKSAHLEKHRICQLYDDKCHEIQNIDRELNKTREEYKELDGRLKWTQSKLRLEIDVNKENAERAEKLSQQVKELEAAKETAILNAADTLRAKQLESELKECQASLILCRHEKDDLERRFTAVSQLLDVCRRDLDGATTTLAEQDVKIKHLEDCNIKLEEEAASLAGLTAQASLAEALAAQLQRETTRANQAEEELSKERARSETCIRREAAALEHAARLTASNVAGTAVRERAEAEAQALSADNKCLREQVGSLEGKVDKLESALTEETDRRNRENRVLARKVAELTEECKHVTEKLEWEAGENAVLKKKHSSAIKELNRELQRALKRCEQLELKRPQSDPETSTRNGSVSSLSSGENAPSCDEKIQQTNDYVPEIQVREPDRQALIERIVQLQRAAARRAERCDFLEEHSKQLTTELRKKSRVLRQLMCTMPTGALSSKTSDDNKKEIARLGGGAMAAVWGGDSTGMTLELSIEMNNKLQAVLEDTLLKNITLKENMDTLGEEIERLKKPNGAG